MWTWLLHAVLAAPPNHSARDEYLASVARMIAIVEATDAATWTFHKQEWADDERQPHQVMAIKYRRNGDTYLSYVGDLNRGREVLYRPLVLPGEILVNLSPLLPTMTFDLHGRRARDGERYAVDNLSLHELAAAYRRDNQRLADRGFVGFDVTDLGKRLVGSEGAHCWLAVLPKDQVPTLYAERVETCLSEQTGVVISLRAWDRVGSEQVMVEDYRWANMQLNLTLTDTDFDPDNPAYRF